MLRLCPRSLQYIESVISTNFSTEVKWYDESVGLDIYVTLNYALWFLLRIPYLKIVNLILHGKIYLHFCY
jgi:hypothetical protein